MKKITFEKYSSKYYKELYDLQVAQWGEGSDSNEIFEKLEDYIIELAICDKQLAGSSICHKQSNGTLYLDMIVIKPNFQKMGIGTKFLNNIIEYAKNNKYKKIECAAIEANGHTNSQKLIENFGFIRTQTIKNYWGDLYPNFECKECGHTPCICTMHHYEKML